MEKGYVIEVHGDTLTLMTNGVNFGVKNIDGEIAELINTDENQYYSQFGKHTYWFVRKGEYEFMPTHSTHDQRIKDWQYVITDN